MASKPVDDYELENLARAVDVAHVPMPAYEQVPLVTLEEAIQSLVSLVPDVKQMFRQVKERCHESNDGLTWNESASIMLYSLESEARENSFHVILNDRLKSDDREALRPWYPYLKLFTKALSKLPSLHGYVYRGVQTNLRGDYAQGKTFTWSGFSRCTRSIDRVEQEHGSDRTGERTRFKIESKSVKDIRNHVLPGVDDEAILLLPPQRYKVVSSLHSDNGLHTIQVKEIESFPVSQQPSNDDRTSSLSLSLNHRKASFNLSIRETSFCSVVLKLTVGSARLFCIRAIFSLLGIIVFVSQPSIGRSPQPVQARFVDRSIGTGINRSGHEYYCSTSGDGQEMQGSLSHRQQDHPPEYLASKRCIVQQYHTDRIGSVRQSSVGQRCSGTRRCPFVK